LVNDEQQLTIVASELDPASGRIVEFLAENYGVLINVLFFRHFSDNSNDYLARTWLLDPRSIEAKSRQTLRSKKRPWNGRDFYIVQGNKTKRERRWDLAYNYGFLNAGGESQYWMPLKRLARGKRVFAYVGEAGYVGVGEVTGEMISLRDAEVEIHGQSQPLIDQPDLDKEIRDRAARNDPEETEKVVPVKWLAKRTLDQAVPSKGLFTSPLIVCKLRDEHTIAELESKFGLDSATN